MDYLPTVQSQYKAFYVIYQPCYQRHYFWFIIYMLSRELALYGSRKENHKFIEIVAQ